MQTRQMQTRRWLFTFIVVLGLAAGCGGTSFTTAHVWRTTPVRGVITHPEVRYLDATPPAGDCPQDFAIAVARDLQHLRGREIGVAFSGGGTRAATATLGQLRALRELGLLGAIKYFSSVSGGTWGVLPFTYLSGVGEQQHLDEAFLGRFVAPEALGWGAFDHPSSDFARAIDGTFQLDDRVAAYLRYLDSDSYAMAVGSAFLKPFGLQARDATVAAGPCTRALLQQDIPGLAVHTPAPGRPFLIVNATILARERLDRSAQDTDLYPIEFTPLYTGAAAIDPAEPQARQSWAFGGGYVETFASEGDFDRLPVFEDGLATLPGSIPDTRHQLTLLDMMGASGAAPVQTLATLPLVNPARMGFPVQRHRPVGSRLWLSGVEYPLGDGGHMDNLALIALLSRQVDKIIVMVNTLTPFAKVPFPFCKECVARRASLPARAGAACLLPGGGLAAECLQVFDDGQDFREYIHAYRKFYLSDLLELFGHERANLKIHVLAQQGLPALLKGLHAKKAAGAPLVHCAQFEVQDNPHVGVSATRADGTPYTPTICWNYLDAARPWREAVARSKLSAKLKQQILTAQKPVERFPHYKTGLQEGLQAIDLDVEAIEALSNLTAWTLQEAWKDIREAFGPTVGVTP